MPELEDLAGKIEAKLADRDKTIEELQKKVPTDELMDRLRKLAS
jgi:hypothetical protein